MTRIIDPSQVAADFRDHIRREIETLGVKLHLAGLLATDYGPSQTYADYTRKGCEDVGISFELRKAPRTEMEDIISAVNDDPSVHGVMVYYPVFGIEQDNYIKDLVAPEKDIEGMNTSWLRRLYSNTRYTDTAKQRKAILPCTPLAILKLLESTGLYPSESPYAGKVVTIFNRSEVVGRPLASMMAHDGAEIYSFDISGAVRVDSSGVTETKITRGEALAQSDIVITGVPSRDFMLIKPEEIKPGTVCINFSTFRNFSDEAIAKAGVFVPRVGPMTVTMALRNTLRLYKNYKSQ